MDLEVSAANFCRQLSRDYSFKRTPRFRWDEEVAPLLHLDLQVRYQVDCSARSNSLLKWKTTNQRS